MACIILFKYEYFPVKSDYQCSIFTDATAVLEKLSTPKFKLLESSGDSIGFQMCLTLEPVLFFCLFLFLWTFIYKNVSGSQQK